MTSILDGGTVNATGGIQVSQYASIVGNGSLVGDVTNDGTITPSNSSAVGTLAITGDYTQASTGILNIGLNSLEVDQLTVSGNTSLSGSLHLYPFTSSDIEPDFTILEYDFLATGGTESGAFTGLPAGALGRTTPSFPRTAQATTWIMPAVQAAMSSSSRRPVRLIFRR